MSTSKSERMKATIAALREKVAPSLKSSGVAMGGGALANIGFGVASDRIGVLQGAWYYEPLILAAVGHFVKRKNHDLGVGILGAAGYAAAQNSQVGFAVRGMVSQSVGKLGAGDAGDAGAALDQGYIANVIAQSVGANLAQLMAGQGAGDAGAMAYPGDAGGMVGADVGFL
jgi:hypothetical protein